MRLEQVATILREHQAELHRWDIASLAVFGSVARGEAGPDSDVDLLVEFSRPISLIRYMDIQDHLSELLGCVVDLVPKDSIKLLIRESVLREAVDVA